MADPLGVWYDQAFGELCLCVVAKQDAANKGARVQLRNSFK